MCRYIFEYKVDMILRLDQYFFTYKTCTKQFASNITFFEIFQSLCYKLSKEQDTKMNEL